MLIFLIILFAAKYCKENSMAKGFSLNQDLFLFLSSIIL